MAKMTKGEMRAQLVTDPQVLLTSTGLKQMQRQAKFWQNEVRQAQARLDYALGAQARLDADVADSEGERDICRYNAGFAAGERDCLEHVSAMAELASEALADYAALRGGE